MPLIAICLALIMLAPAARAQESAPADDAADRPHLTPFQWKKPVPTESDSSDVKVWKGRPALREQPEQQPGQESDWECETIDGPQQVCHRKSTGDGVVGADDEHDLYDPKTGKINEGLLNAVESRGVGFRVPPLPEMKGPRKFPVRAQSKPPKSDAPQSSSTAAVRGQPEASALVPVPTAARGDGGLAGETPRLLR